VNKKTKYLNIQRKEDGLNDTDIDSQYLTQVKSYKYLGSMEIISLRKKLKKELFSAVKVIMPIKTQLKANY
jgi:hypothetical protein